MKYYKTEILAFFAGALVMVFEILGARIFGPFIGTSLFVWTSIIAVVLGALAAGYYHGGIVADKGAGNTYLSRLFFVTGITFLILYVYKEPILILISSNIFDVRLSSLLLSLILLAPSSYLLGMIPPILIKSELTDLDTGGHTIGRLGSIGTVGSIVGTLATGFFLLPYFGVNTLILFLSIFCILLSMYVVVKLDTVLRVIFIFLISLAGFHEYLENKQLLSQNIHIYNSPYSRIEVSDSINWDGRAIRNLFVDNITHAGRFLDSDELLYEYTKYYHLFRVLNPESKRVIMLGGAAYSFPQDFLLRHPEKYIDVVEIDPQMTYIAKKHFGLSGNPRLRTIHEDARVFLNRNTEIYDAILGDAFGSFFSVPYQLTTLETVQRKYDSLSENGVVLLNIIGAMEGEKSRFIQAQYNTYKAVFPDVFLLPVTDERDVDITQNIILVALKNPLVLQTLDTETLSREHKVFLSRKTFLPKNSTPILTDNFAPVDYYIKALARYYE